MLFWSLVIDTSYLWFNELIYSRGTLVQIYAEIHFSFLPLLSIVSLAIAAYFFRTAFTYRDHMVFYLTGVGRFGETASSAKRIGRLAFWLAVSALSTLGMVVSGGSIMYVLVMPVDYDPNLMFATYAVYIFNRITVSFAQVRFLLAF